MSRKIFDKAFKLAAVKLILEEDQLMSAEGFKFIAQEFIEVYERFESIK